MMKWITAIKALLAAADQLEQKDWRQSKTIWFNLLSALSMVAVAVAGPQFELPADTLAALAGGIVAVVNIGLRFVTKTPVRLRGANNPTGAEHEQRQDR